MAPTKREFSQLIGAYLRYGRRGKVARHLNVSGCDISRRLNPCDERALYMVRALDEAEAFCRSDRELGLALKHYINGLIDSWIEPEPHPGELPDLACQVNLETTELMNAHALGKPVHVQRKETLDVISAGFRMLHRLGEAGAKVSDFQRKVGTA